MIEVDLPVEGAAVGDLCESDKRSTQPAEDAAQFEHFADQMVNRFGDAVAGVFRHDRLEQLRIAFFRRAATDAAFLLDVVVTFPRSVPEFSSS